jgi:hypothetical protein
MPTTTKSFGLSFRYGPGDYQGLECCVMEEYGRPALFETYDAALKHGIGIYGKGFQDVQCKVVPARKAQELCERFVEIMSGRRTFKDGVLSSGNPDRASYKRVMEILAKIAAGEDYRLSEITAA